MSVKTKTYQKGFSLLREAAKKALSLGGLIGLLWGGGFLQSVGAVSPVERAYLLSLAYVKTGHVGDEKMAEAGLRTLSDALKARTAVETDGPVGVNLLQDDLSFYPFLYWPLRSGQPLPTGAALEKLITFMNTGGLLVMDQMDTPSGSFMGEIAQRLRLPPLMPLQSPHVLLKTFYLLPQGVGRTATPSIWVEASEAGRASEGNAEEENINNDGVSPIIVGNGQWATAWAQDKNGTPLAPVYGGEDVRELALRFGVNMVMYSLTGNYKADQIHTAPLLERLR